MAWLNMYNQNSNHKGLSMSPRISFSNDFVDTNHSLNPHKHEQRSSREAQGSTDFEFSVSNDSMMSADELFFKGRLLPYKDSGAKTTLRDELMTDEDGDRRGKGLMKPPKGAHSSRWKELLGLKRAHIGSKKSAAKSDGVVEKKHGLVQEQRTNDRFTGDGE